LLAGEASGDLHGATLAQAVRERAPGAVLEGWGGEKMQAAGVGIHKHYHDLAFMGFVEVVKHLPAILRNFKTAKEEILRFRPDVLVLIDYPGFNLRIAKWARAQGIRVVYYISPQLWAWKEGRVKTVREAVDKMLVILPFEKAFYARHGLDVEFVGHPLVDVVAAAGAAPATAPLSDKPIIALLPGSRAMEIRQKLPVMLEAAARFPHCQAVVAGAPAQDPALYASLMQGSDARILYDRTYDLLREARAALVTSGTATLETALFGVPQAVCYRGNPVSTWLARRLIKVKYISLVNLILDEALVEELIQNDLTADRAATVLEGLLEDGPARARVVEGYERLRTALGGGGAAGRAADAVLEVAMKK